MEEGDVDAEKTSRSTSMKVAGKTINVLTLKTTHKLPDGSYGMMGTNNATGTSFYFIMKPGVPPQSPYTEVT